MDANTLTSLIVGRVYRIAKSDYWLRHVYLSVCLSICPSVCPSVYLSVCLSVRLSA